MFNPKVTDLMKENEDLTVMGLFWAGYWRFTLVVGGVYLGIILLAVFATEF